ncbi:MAG: LPS-assembly protein LptD [Hydrogenophilaceae bacterium]|nr:LPS-assembly protein LptD [Hydrogenophilaceae bacterium]
MRLSLGFFLFSLALSGWVPARASDAPLILKKDIELRGSQVAGNQGPLFLSADVVQSISENVIEASGKVEARKAGQNFFADTLRYDRALNQIEASGKVRLEQSKLVVSGSRLKLQLDSHTGFLIDPKYRILPAPDVRITGRGEAKKLEFAGQEIYSAKDATYTTCPVGNDDWYLKVADLEIDQNRQVGTARNVLLTFKDVPLLYAPWADFSLNDARKTGFLPPTIGFTGKSGLDITLPYYFNLAPNYDATLYPRLLASRGIQLGSEFRYLMPSYHGEAALEFLPDDQTDKRSRWLATMNHDHRFNSRLRGVINFLRVSDDEYFRDLSNQVTVTSRSILPQEGTLTYEGYNWQAGLRVQQLQVLQDPDAPINPTPYNRLPQVTLSGNRQLRDLKAEIESEYVHFEHPTLVDGKRLTLYPSIRLPYQTSSYFITPKLGYHFTRYELENNPVYPEQKNRSLPIASLDTGLFMERDFSFRGKSYLQTLEPRAFYVNVPYRNQNDIPLFDSAPLDLSFAQIFTENQFTGSDRINDANQLTLALTSRFIDESNGLERLKVAFGQRYYFSSQKVTLNPGDPVRDSSSTDLLALLSGQINDAWRLDSGWQFDTDLGKTIKSTISASYRPAPGRAASMGYRFLDGSVEQLDSAFQWPLTSRLYSLARANYSFRDNRLIEGLAGLEYNGGCWVLRGVVQRIATAEKDVSNSFYLQLELNGMGRLGASPMSALKESIPGYIPSNEFQNP